MLLGLVGAVVGALAGFFTGGLFAFVTVCRGGDGSLGAGESCGMSAAILSFLGVPIGALIGAFVGAVVGARRPRASATATATSGEGGALPRGGGPPVAHEASPLATLAVVGGIAIAFGAFTGWRTVWIPYEDLDRYGRVLTPGPEGIAFLGGLLVLAGGTLSVLRPARREPPIVVAVGTVLAAAAALWAFVDLLGVPAELRWEIYLGFWISIAGAAASAAGWLIQRRRVGSAGG